MALTEQQRARFDRIRSRKVGVSAPLDTTSESLTEEQRLRFERIKARRQEILNPVETKEPSVIDTVTAVPETTRITAPNVVDRLPPDDYQQSDSLFSTPPPLTKQVDTTPVPPEPSFTQKLSTGLGQLYDGYSLALDSANLSTSVFTNNTNVTLSDDEKVARGRELLEKRREVYKKINALRSVDTDDSWGGTAKNLLIDTTTLAAPLAEAVKQGSFVGTVGAVGGLLGGPGTSLALGTSGFASGTFSYWYRSSYGNLYLDQLEQGRSHNLAHAVSSVAAGPIAAINQLRVQQIVGPGISAGAKNLVQNPTVQKLLNSTLVNRITRAIDDKVATPVAKVVSDKISDKIPAVSSATRQRVQTATQTGVNLTGNVLAELTEEVAQTLTEDLAQDFSALVETGEFTEGEFATDYVKDVEEIFSLSGAISLLVVGSSAMGYGGVTAYDKLSNRKQIDAVKTVAKSLTDEAFVELGIDPGLSLGQKVRLMRADIDNVSTFLANQRTEGVTTGEEAESGVDSRPAITQEETEALQSKLSQVIDEDTGRPFDQETVRYYVNEVQNKTLSYESANKWIDDALKNQTTNVPQWEEARTSFIRAENERNFSADLTNPQGKPTGNRVFVNTNAEGITEAVVSDTEGKTRTLVSDKSYDEVIRQLQYLGDPELGRLTVKEGQLEFEATEEEAYSPQTVEDKPTRYERWADEDQTTPETVTETGPQVGVEGSASRIIYDRLKNTENIWDPRERQQDLKDLREWAERSGYKDLLDEAISRKIGPSGVEGMMRTDQEIASEKKTQRTIEERDRKQRELLGIPEDPDPVETTTATTGIEGIVSGGDPEFKIREGATEYQPEPVQEEFNFDETVETTQIGQKLEAPPTEDPKGPPSRSRSGRVTILGTRAPDKQTMGKTFEPLRNKSSEWVYIVLRDAETGEVLSVDANSFRLPGVAPTIKDIAQSRRGDARFKELLRQRISRLRASRGVQNVVADIVHNHPGGSAKPSEGDAALTSEFAEMFDPIEGVTFGEHTIVDTGEAASIQRDGSWRIYDIYTNEDLGSSQDGLPENRIDRLIEARRSDPLYGQYRSDEVRDSVDFLFGAGPTDQSDISAETLRNATNAKIAKFLKEDQGKLALAVILDGQLNVRNLIPFSMNLMKNPEEFSRWSLNVRRENGGRNLVVYYGAHDGQEQVGQDEFSGVVSDAIASGEVLDAVYMPSRERLIRREVVEERGPIPTEGPADMPGRVTFREDTTPYDPERQRQLGIQPPEDANLTRSDDPLPDRITLGDPIREKAFRRWWRRSKVSDEQNKPKIMFHGTKNQGLARSEQFGIEIDRPLEAGDIKVTEMGFHFGNQDQANWIGLADKPGDPHQYRFDYDGMQTNEPNPNRTPMVLPVYLSIQNPLRVIDQGSFRGATILNLIESGKTEIDPNDPKVIQVLNDAEAKMIQAENDPDFKGFSEDWFEKTDDETMESIQNRIMVRALEELGYDGLVYLNRAEGVYEKGTKNFITESTLNNAFESQILSRGTDEQVLTIFDASDSYVAFRPEQIKSATGNRGTFSPTDPNYLREGSEAVYESDVEIESGSLTTEESESLGSTKFINPLYEVLQEKMPNKATPEAVLGMVKKTKMNKKGEPIVTLMPNVKQDQLDDTGFEAWITSPDRGKSVTKEEVLQYIADNTPAIYEEVVTQEEGAGFSYWVVTGSNNIHVDDEYYDDEYEADRRVEEIREEHSDDMYEAAYQIFDDDYTVTEEEDGEWTIKDPTGDEETYVSEDDYMQAKDEIIYEQIMDDNFVFDWTPQVLSPEEASDAGYENNDGNSWEHYGEFTLDDGENVREKYTVINLEIKPKWGPTQAGRNYIKHTGPGHFTTKQGFPSLGHIRLTERDNRGFDDPERKDQQQRYSASTLQSHDVALAPYIQNPKVVFADEPAQSDVHQQAAKIRSKRVVKLAHRMFGLIVDNQTRDLAQQPYTPEENILLDSITDERIKSGDSVNRDELIPFAQKLVPKNYGYDGIDALGAERREPWQIEADLRSLQDELKETLPEETIESMYDSQAGIALNLMNRKMVTDPNRTYVDYVLDMYVDDWKEIVRQEARLRSANERWDNRIQSRSSLRLGDHRNGETEETAKDIISKRLISGELRGNSKVVGARKTVNNLLTEQEIIEGFSSFNILKNNFGLDSDEKAEAVRNLKDEVRKETNFKIKIIENILRYKVDAQGLYSAVQVIKNSFEQGKVAVTNDQMYYSVFSREQLENIKDYNVDLYKLYYFLAEEQDAEKDKESKKIEVEKGDWEEYKQFTYLFSNFSLHDFDKSLSEVANEYRESDSKIVAFEQKERELIAEQKNTGEKEGVGEVPFKKSWAELFFKRGLAHAINSQAGFFAWPKTKEQVESIEHWGSMSDEDGRNRIVRRYTEELPRFIKKYIKKIDPDVEIKDLILDTSNKDVVSAIPITDKIIKKLKDGGQYLYEDSASYDDGSRKKKRVAEIYRKVVIEPQQQERKAKRAQAKTEEPTPTPEPDAPITARERGFSESLRDRGRLSPDQQDRFYVPQSNIETRRQAETIYVKDGIKGVLDQLGEAEDDTPSALRTALGIVAYTHFEEDAKRLDAEGDNDGADEARGEAVRIAGLISRRLTKAGQSTQAASMIAMLDPDTVLLWAQRWVDRMNERYKFEKGTEKERDLTKRDKLKLKDLAGKAKELSEIGLISQNINSILDDLSKGNSINGDQAQAIKDFKERVSDVVREEEEAKEEGKKPKRIEMGWAKLFRRKVQGKAEEARKRLKEEGILAAGIPADRMSDLIVVGMQAMLDGAKSFDTWRQSMRADLAVDLSERDIRIAYNSTLKEYNSNRKLAAREFNQIKAIDQFLSSVEENPSLKRYEDVNVLAQAIGSMSKVNEDARIAIGQEMELILTRLEPRTMNDYFATYLHIAGLLAVKTMERNVIGNGLMWKAERLKHLMSVSIDKAVGRPLLGERKIAYTPAKSTTMKAYRFLKGIPVMGVNESFQQAYPEFYEGWRAGREGRSPKGLPTMADLPKGLTYDPLSEDYRRMEGKAFGGARQTAYRALSTLEGIMSASLRGFDFAAYMRAFNVTLQEQADLIIINENKKFDSKEDRKAWVDSWVAKADHNSHEVADGFARYVTFQDDTYLATIATTMKRILNLDRTLFSKLSPKRFGQRRSDPDYIDTTIPFGEFVLRYPKVPANLLNRGLAYSPAGFAKAAYDLYTAQKLIRDGKVEGSAKYRQGVESLSRALLGTGLTAFTAKLSSLNIMSGGDEEEKVRANQLRADVTGEKQNQINIDALRRYIISGFDDRAAKRRRGDVLIDYAWAQPLAFSASFGVNYQEAQEVESLKDQTETMTGALGEETEETIRGMIKGVTGASEILTEQPMLSGLKDLFRSYGQETNYLENIVRILEGIPSSMVPQMIGQLRQFNDNTKRQAWAGRNPAQRAVNRLMNRLPFLSERLPAAYKVLGQNVPREIYANGNNTWYNVWFNPAWVSEYNPDPLAIELLKNYEETLSVGTLPRKQTTTIEPGDGKKYQLTNEDISQLQRIMAGYVTRFASREIRDPDYRTLEPEEQVKNLSGHVNDSAQMARDWFLVNRVNKYLSSKSKRDRKYMEKLKELQEEAQDRLTENRN